MKPEKFKDSLNILQRKTPVIPPIYQQKKNSTKKKENIIAKSMREHFLNDTIYSLNIQETPKFVNHNNFPVNQQFPTRMGSKDGILFPKLNEENLNITFQPTQAKIDTSENHSNKTQKKSKSNEQNSLLKKFTRWFFKNTTDPNHQLNQSQ